MYRVSEGFWLLLFVRRGPHVVVQYQKLWLRSNEMNFALLRCVWGKDLVLFSKNLFNLFNTNSQSILSNWHLNSKVSHRCSDMIFKKKVKLPAYCLTGLRRSLRYLLFEHTRTAWCACARSQQCGQRSSTPPQPGSWRRLAFWFVLQYTY